MKRFMGAAAILLGLFAFGTAQAAPATKGAPVGAQCVSCHETEAKAHMKHAYHGDCLSCHTAGTEHAKAEEARENATGKDKPKSVVAGLPKTEQCQSCHKNDAKHMNFAFSEHARANVQCSDCHGNHSPKIKTLTAGMERAGKEAALCISCHKDVAAKFNLRSRHPLKEGGVTCVSCHDAHGGKQLTLVAKTQQCTQCHQNVRGPHVFEHGPVTEDCTTCHNPHGTHNQKLLTLAQPAMCIQCHTITGNRHGQTGAAVNTQIISATALRNCSSCHSQVHGSSRDQHFRY